MRKDLIDAVSRTIPQKVGELVKWLKHATLMLEEYEPITGEEMKFVNDLYFEHCTRLADEQEVPVGWMISNAQMLAAQEFNAERNKQMEFDLDG